MKESCKITQTNVEKIIRETKTSCSNKCTALRKDLEEQHNALKGEVEKILAAVK